MPDKPHLPTKAIAEARAELLRILIRRSVRRGHFTLASGKTSDLYVNCKLTALDPAGAILIGQLGWDLIRDAAAELNLKIDSVGGLTLGADPIALSIGVAAELETTGVGPQVFIVRKVVKEHGTKLPIEGNFSAGQTVVVIEDVITSGGSALQAIEAVEAAGAKVGFVLALVDRDEGGRQNLESRGYRVFALFNREDVFSSAPTAE